ncbi:MAG: HAD family phosphatase [Deltaproteobacteria bacterium]|nr:MAG: HAD family phosphatase [Deltaproteobacteria bacterium]
MLDGVIFDFDGVIADDERLHLAGFQHALAAHGIELDEAEYFARYVGYDDRDGFRAILRDRGRSVGDEELGRLMAEKARVFRELVRERVRIFPGVRDLLEDLRRPPAPVPTGIGSGALRAEVELVLRVAGLAGLFDAIVCADDVERGKPDPETYRRVAEKLGEKRPGLMPQRCVVIEDTHAGLEAARRAGMVTVAVTNSHPAAELEADLVIASLEDLDRERLERLVESAGP